LTTQSPAGGNDAELVEAAEKFTNLTGLATDMWKVSTHGISAIARNMGTKLLDLRVMGDCITKHYLNDATLSVIAQHCVNLKRFTYQLSFTSYYHEHPMLDTMTGTGLVALVDGCRSLEYLEMGHILGIKQDKYQSIIDAVNQGKGAASANGKGYALQKIVLKGYGFRVSSYPFQIESA